MFTFFIWGFWLLRLWPPKAKIALFSILGAPIRVTALSVLTVWGRVTVRLWMPYVRVLGFPSSVVVHDRFFRVRGICDWRLRVPLQIGGLIAIATRGSWSFTGVSVRTVTGFWWVPWRFCWRFLSVSFWGGLTLSSVGWGAVGSVVGTVCAFVVPFICPIRVVQFFCVEARLPPPYLICLIWVFVVLLRNFCPFPLSFYRTLHQFAVFPVWGSLWYFRVAIIDYESSWFWGVVLRGHCWLVRILCIFVF
jgi:hypothetical protein